MTSKLWWLIHKDLVVEYRTRQAWPAMLLLGVIMAVVLNLQIEIPVEHRSAATGAMLWLAILFAGLITIDRSCSAEQENRCWDGLTLYPMSPAAIFLAKAFVNFVALLVLECLLVPLFAVLADAPLLRNTWAMVLVAVLGSASMAAAGTLVSAITHGLRQRTAVLSLLLLPLLLPVVLAGAAATRLMIDGDFSGDWWRWVQFLAAFAIVFSTLGIVLFGFLVEE
jgi:heme exporter protein B